MEEEKLVGQLADDVVQIRREVGILVHDGKRLLEGIDVDLFVRDDLHAVSLSLDIGLVGILAGLVGQLLLHLSEGIQNDLLILFRQGSEGVKYATIMFATVPILCVYPFIQKYFVKGVMLGSLKG